MKKILFKLLAGIIAVTMLAISLVGCGSSSWTGTKMTSWGEGDIIGGFIGEKGNYVYYINGVGSNVSDNTFGVPVKASLMVADKNDLSKTEIAVPKLFVASDYNAGLYIFGDYVYYATPNTDKNSSGEIANTELTFMKTKLDGTDRQTFFSIPGISSEYRIVKANDKVFIVYYDEDETALKAYDTSKEQAEVIVKTDVKTSSRETLNAYMFAENGDSVNLYYTVTVYSEDYLENKDGDRATASYNEIYSFTLGQDEIKNDGTPSGKKITDGASKFATYALTMVKADNLFYTESINSVSTTYMVDMKGGAPVKVTNTAAAVATNLIYSANEVYTLTEGVITKTVLTGKYEASTQNVAIATGATTLLAKNGEYMYFIDAESGLSRIKLGNESANIEKVSEDSISAYWYPIQFIGNNVFYCDNSSTGSSYVKYVDVTSAVKEEKVDENTTKYYLEGQKFLGEMIEADEIAILTAKINGISASLENGALPFAKDEDGKFLLKDGKIYVEEVDAIDIAGINITEETKKTLDTYKLAIEKANLYYKLEGIRSDLAKKEDYESIYNEVKNEIEAFINSEDYNTVSAYIGKNLLWNYGKADKWFNAESE